MLQQAHIPGPYVLVGHSERRALFGETPALGRFLRDDDVKTGSANFTHLPINAPKCPFANHQRDGHGQRLVLEQLPRDALHEHAQLVPWLVARLVAAPGSELTIDVRGKPRRARVVRRPIYKREE